MSLRRILTAVGLLAAFGLWLATGASAQVRIEVPRVDVPDRRPDTSTSIDMGDLVGGVFALRDGYDRSRRGFICILTYEDRNGNGRRDRGEGPLPGWSFGIADGSGAIVAQGVTDRDGRFCNQRPVEPGAYVVRGAPGAGWTSTEPGGPAPHKPVTLPRDRSVTLLFGNCEGERCARGQTTAPVAAPATTAGWGPWSPPLCVEKYNDLNGNGSRDPGEPLMSGWNFTIRDPANVVVGSGPTDATGRLCTTVTVDTFTVTETPQAGWITTQPAGGQLTRTVAVPAGPGVTVQFGNQQVPQFGELCVEKFNDLNGDGVRQPGELGMPGWTFDFKRQAGSGYASVQQGTSGPDGRYCSGQTLQTGAYQIVETLQLGWTMTRPAGGVIQDQVVAGASRTILVGNRFAATSNPVATICITKYRDENSNAVRDPGEILLPNWSFTIREATNYFLATVTTDATGTVCTPVSLAPGVYTVTENLWSGSGWTSTDPGGWTPTKTVTTAVGQTSTVVFGNRAPPGRLCVEKFNDLNGDGVRQPSEPWGTGVTFTATNAQGVLAYTGVIGSLGKFCTPTNMHPGVYTVAEVVPPGWVNTVPGGSATMPFTVNSGSQHWITFINVPASRICVSKYNDVNGDGRRDPGEPPLAGWHFSVRNAANTVVGQGTTDGQGQFCTPLTLGPGTYSVRETPQTNSGWTQSDPAANADHSVVLTPGQTGQAVFGNRRPPAGGVCVAKFNDLNGDGQRQPIEGMIPGVSFTVRDVSGAAVASLTTNAQGEACSGWIFSPGAYSVTEQVPPGWTTSIPGGIPTLPAQVTANADAEVWFGNRQDPLNHDLRIDTNFHPDYLPNTADTYIIGYYLSDTQPIPPGSRLVVTGSLTPAGPFSGMVVVTPGWTCTGPWSAFQCVLSTTSGAASELLELQTTYPAGSAGQSATYSASVDLDGNTDPNPANNSRTATTPLF